MSIFGKSLTDLLFGSSISSITDTLEKLETVFTDVDTEGEKRGYERAAAEYDAAYMRIESRYQTALKLLDKQKTDKDSEAKRLISKLKQLEKDKMDLEDKVREKTRQVSDTYDIPVSSVSRNLASGTLLIGGYRTSILDLIYKHKSKKLQEAEERGYAEARLFHEKKIKELKDNLEGLKKRKNADLQDLSNIIIEALDEISDEETKIAELEIILKNL